MLYYYNPRSGLILPNYSPYSTYKGFYTWDETTPYAICPICYGYLKPIQSTYGNKYVRDTIMTKLGNIYNISSYIFPTEYYKQVEQILMYDLWEIRHAKVLETFERNYGVPASERTIFTSFPEEDENRWADAFSGRGYVFHADTVTTQLIKKYITEIRDSIEKIFYYGQITKQQFFNYDILANYITRLDRDGIPTGDQLDWHDSDLTLVKQARAIHIEDLRHPIPCAFCEAWGMESGAWGGVGHDIQYDIKRYPTYNGGKYIHDETIFFETYESDLELAVNNLHLWEGKFNVIMYNNYYTPPDDCYGRKVMHFHSKPESTGTTFDITLEAYHPNAVDGYPGFYSGKWVYVGAYYDYSFPGHAWSTSEKCVFFMYRTVNKRILSNSELVWNSGNGVRIAVFYCDGYTGSGYSNIEHVIFDTPGTHSLAPYAGKLLLDMGVLFGDENTYVATTTANKHPITTYSYWIKKIYIKNLRYLEVTDAC